jgi:hypothetical protein
LFWRFRKVCLAAASTATHPWLDELYLGSAWPPPAIVETMPHLFDVGSDDQRDVRHEGGNSVRHGRHKRRPGNQFDGAHLIWHIP